MLRGKNINLRLVREADLTKLYADIDEINDRGEYDTMGLLSESFFKREFHENGFWQDKHGTMLITDKEDQIKGSISFFKSIPNFNGLEIGFVIHNPIDRGKGYVTEATMIFTAYLFAEREITRLQATTFPGNIPSNRVLLKCGFQLEGVARKARFHRGQYLDVNLYSLLREESRPLKTLLS